MEFTNYHALGIEEYNPPRRTPADELDDVNDEIRRLELRREELVQRIIDEGPGKLPDRVAVADEDTTTRRLGNKRML